MKAQEQSKVKSWKIVRVRKDVASGKDSGRPGYQELIAAIKAGDVDVVVVYRLDRLSRNVRDIYDFLDLIKNHGVGFCSISEGFDTTTAMGRAMLGVAAVFAQLTREMIAENVKDGLLRRAESGKWNGPKWNPPYGYRYVVGGTIEPDEAQAQIVRRIFDWFTRSKWGATKIARALNSEGVTKDCGKKGSGQWRQSIVWAVVRNPVYAGYLVAGDKLVEGQHDAIIDDETWELAKEIVVDRKKSAPRTKASPHLLSGLVRCGKCNRMLVAQLTRYKRKDGEGCFVGFRHGRNEFVGELHCPGVYHRADTLEEAVVSAILELSKTPELMDMVCASARKQVVDEVQPLRDKVASVTGELAELDRLFDDWANRLDRRVIDDAQFEQHNSELLKKKAKLQGELEELNRKLSEGERIEISLAEVQQILKYIPAVWASLQFEERREVLKLLVERVAVHPDKVELHLFHLPPQNLQTHRPRRQHQRKSRATKQSEKNDARSG